MPLFSKPAHGEKINDNGRSTRQFQTFLEDFAELHDLTSMPVENEIIFKNGVASIQLKRFFDQAASVASLTPPSDGDIILTNNSANFAFQSFIDDLAV
jgi:hypothetical protein